MTTPNDVKRRDVTCGYAEGVDGIRKMTVDSLSELDLSYTPPLGSPWDATQMAAQAWVREHQPATARPLTA